MRHFWNEVTEPLVRLRAPRRVVEVGSESGQSTLWLLELCRELGAHADIIDPAPPQNLDTLRPLLEACGTLHQATSLEVIPQLPVADVYLIDGDHNWHTVFHELGAILAKVDAENARTPLILMHDVGWPYGRRDLYYDTRTVPESGRHPSARGGLHPNHSELLTYGGINADLEHAMIDGGEKNGVLTAVEDFQAEHPDRYIWGSLPVYHGYGFLIPASEREQPYAKSALGMMDDNPALLALSERVERERILAIIRAGKLRLEKDTAHRQVARLEGEIRRLEKQVDALERAPANRASEKIRRLRGRVRGWTQRR